MIPRDERFEKLMGLVSDQGCVFHLNLNMNDVFAWGCADSEDMDASDLEEVFPIYEKYGSPALIAYASIKREGQLPQAPVLERIKKEFYAAKAELEPLAAKGEILFDAWHDREKGKKV